MDQKRKQEIYALFKSAFLKISEQTLEYVKAKTQLTQKEIEDFVNENLLYYFSDDKEKIIKKEKLEFKLYKLTSESETDIKILELKEVLEKELGEIAYIRFNQKVGHVALPTTIENPVNKTIVFEDKKEMKISEMNLEEKKEFSKEHGPHIEGILRYKYGRQCKIKVDGLLSHKRGIYLGYTKFKSLQEMKSIFMKALKNTKEGERIGEPVAGFLKELFNYHPKCSKKLENFDHFEVQKHPDHGDTKCFFVVKSDGTKEDFSSIKCVKEIAQLIKQQIKWIKISGKC